MDDQKETYRLWFEYLRRNDDYREFCEWYREHQKDKSLPLPGKFKARLSQGLDPYMMLISTFSDVYNTSFDEWWERQKVRLKRIFKNRERGPIEDYMVGEPSLEDDLNHCIDAFKQSEGREPSANELKTNFLQFLKRKSDETLFLRVDMSYQQKSIKDGLRKWLNSNGVKKKMDDAKPWRWLKHHRYKKRTGQTPIEDLQLYLEVYDMWKEKVLPRKPGDPSGWNKIIQHFEPGSQERTVDQCTKSFKRKYGKKPGILELQEILDEERKRYSSLERKYKRYKENAEKIISNAARGYFPDKY
jgi:hypothetical protein